MIHFTSDTHFSHANVIEYSKRPFTDTTHMDEILIANWNKHVSITDTVYHLGDFSLSTEAVEKYVKRLNGNIILVLGNHDKPHTSHKGKTHTNHLEWIHKYKDLGFFDVVMDLKLFGLINHDWVQLAHLPYEDPTDFYRNEPTKLRYTKYRLPDEGLVQIHGHQHEKMLTSRTEKGTLMINVGMDAPNAPWSGQFRPATLEEVKEVYERYK